MVVLGESRLSEEQAKMVILVVLVVLVVLGVLVGQQASRQAGRAVTWGVECRFRITGRSVIWRYGSEGIGQTSQLLGLLGSQQQGS